MIAILLCSTLAALAGAVPQLNLNLTAISATDNTSTLECWELSTPVSLSTTPSTAGAISQSLGDVTNFTLVNVPAGFDGGQHTTPIAQLVYYISGLVHISVPNGDEVYVFGGPQGIILTTDTSDVSSTGHNTSYPGQLTTTILQIPFADGPPAHRVIHSGACYPNDTNIPGFN